MLMLVSLFLSFLYGDGDLVFAWMHLISFVMLGL